MWTNPSGSSYGVVKHLVSTSHTLFGVSCQDKHLESVGDVTLYRPRTVTDGHERSSLRSPRGAWGVAWLVAFNLKNDKILNPHIYIYIVIYIICIFISSYMHNLRNSRLHHVCPAVFMHVNSRKTTLTPVAEQATTMSSITRQSPTKSLDPCQKSPAGV